ncbi:phosphatase PAP2 family protein [Maribacter sp. X9]|uniref:phosphatase PAP2 family protein n=1 Tax=Maribacter sp. X9 TaxID=3402159 RepID=UPI003AF34504
MRNVLQRQKHKKKEVTHQSFVKRNVIGSLKKVDVLFFVFFIVTTILLVFAEKQTSCLQSLLLRRGYILLAILGFIYLNSLKNWTLLGILRNAYPIIFSGYFYSETVHYNNAFLDNIDPFLENVEGYLFGMQPSVAFSAHFSSPILSELMYLGYFSFYLLILGYTLNVFFWKKEYALKGIFLLSASLYLFYFFFGLVPSAGPQFYFSAPDNILPDAYFFDKIMHFIQHAAEQPTGAFPSSHVGISLVILLLSRKRMPVFFRVALPFTVFLILSTVYIKAHYVIDVIAAIIAAPCVLCLSHILYGIPSKYPDDGT